MRSSKLKNFIKTILPNSLLTHRLPPQAHNSILLTFDDGPDKDLTPVILKQLRQYNAKAIFFVIGEKVSAAPDIFNMIHTQGHIIGNHTLSHPYDNLPAFTQYKKEISDCQNLLQQATGAKPTLFRSPMGIISLTGLLAAKSQGLKTLLWSEEGGEWGARKEKNALAIGHHLVQSLQRRDIVLLHDNNSKVPMILDIILPELKKRGIDLSKAANLV